MGSADVLYRKRRGAATVVFGEKGDFPLLGVTALEALGLIFDPLRRKLKSPRRDFVHPAGPRENESSRHLVFWSFGPLAKFIRDRTTAIGQSTFRSRDRRYYWLLGLRHLLDFHRYLVFARLLVATANQTFAFG